MSIDFTFDAEQHATWSRSSRSLPFSGGASPSSIASNRSRHLYSRRRCTPSSSESATMLSQPFRRSTAIFLNALGYFPTRRLATRRSFPCKLCQFRVSQFWGSVQRIRQRAGLRRSDRGLEARFTPCRDSAACTIVMRQPRRLQSHFSRLN